MANAINSWTEFQTFLDNCCMRVGAEPDFSGHGRWWREMSYQTFVSNGTVKGERIVMVGDPDNSILIHALQGDTPAFSKGGKYGRMPLSTSGEDSGYFTQAEIDEIKDWILRGCPEV
ncbi:hypothetical protein CDO28_20090 (plasmid) [Sinorhizobium meliloti]|uniref:hypothetical protein n=1 Tax=Rhizobium meliloti TaxID=382 RepID=UPI000B49831B|nr:hypothetical protein [Sinorhizobium meliloti]ASP73854.1 hypothetical protein CDO28_20090 [Sinorhizobium meliloti]MDE3858103.1 hypothetical protein [Sinorhizobium meliloti]MQW53413.1 hypothetical protein [Sinorhizobium meliloti]